MSFHFRKKINTIKNAFAKCRLSTELLYYAIEYSPSIFFWIFNQFLRNHLSLSFHFQWMNKLTEQTSPKLSIERAVFEKSTRYQTFNVRMSATPDDQNKSFNLEIEEYKGYRVKLQKSSSTPLNQIAPPPTCPKTIKQSKTKATSTPVKKRGDRGINHVPILEHFSAPAIGIQRMSSGVHTTRQVLDKILQFTLE